MFFIHGIVYECVKYTDFTHIFIFG